jgi:hypothetical protein
VPSAPSPVQCLPASCLTASAATSGVRLKTIQRTHNMSRKANASDTRKGTQKKGGGLVLHADESRALGPLLVKLLVVFDQHLHAQNCISTKRCEQLPDLRTAANPALHISDFSPPGKAREATNALNRVRPSPASEIRRKKSTVSSVAE